jgi:nucleoside-diphosphate-sugar epimerase
MDAGEDTVVVTGSSGLIGSAVANRFGRAEGTSGRFAVVGFDRAGPPYPPPAAECVEVDLTSDASVAEGLRGVRERHGNRIASVIHLAAYYDFSGEPSPLYDEVTVRGTERLLRALQSFDVGQFVFSSTMLVHAPCEPGQRIDESWPLEPTWDYPKSKVKTEHVIDALRGAIPAVILRIAGVYDDRCNSIPLAHQIQRIYERRLTSRMFPGDISHGQSFLHLEDLVEAIRLAVERRAQLPDETTVLLGEPETLSYDELQRAFGQLIHGEAWETRQIPKPLAKAGAWLQDVAHDAQERLEGALGHIGHEGRADGSDGSDGAQDGAAGDEPFIKPWMVDIADDHYALDVTRARTLLGWTPRRTLRDTLPKMVAALKADPPGWYRHHDLAAPPEVQSLPKAS